jgi:hypothetical protein
MKTNLFLAIVLSAAILGCSNNPVNSSKEQSSAAVATTCTVSSDLQLVLINQLEWYL